MFKRMMALAAGLAMVGFPTTFARAATESKTPPRLSFMQGDVSFWRPGADDWVAARLNTALADGDALYTGDGANLEVQIGPGAFLRAGENTQIGLEDQEPNFVQIKVTGGHAAIDARLLSAGESIELDTPNAAFTINRVGYYRVDVADSSTTFITRRGGEAAATPSGGTLTAIGQNQQAVVQGTDAAQVATSDAPNVDDWDRWNYQRGDSAVAGDRGGDALPASMYGGEQLNQYGTWRDTEPYGRVWVPDDVGPTWAPYSTGEWMWDPYYEWTWVDDAPWGWAPYHYGRWIHFGGYWGWAPGPIYAPPVYEPALVGFFGAPGFHVGIGFGSPIGWVALGWGEPLLPWWGHAGFIGRPCWNGWFGPRVVNNVFINKTTIVNVNNINFVNTGVPHAFVAVARDRFGSGGVERARIASVDPRHLQPVHGALPVNAGPRSLAVGGGHGFRPPENMMSRRVVATHAPQAPGLHDAAATRMASAVNPPPRLAGGAQQSLAASNRIPGRPGAARQPGSAPRFAGAPNGHGLMSSGARLMPPPPPQHGGNGVHTSPSSRVEAVPQRPFAVQRNSRWTPPPPPRSRPVVRGGYAFASNPPARSTTLSRGAPPPPASRAYAAPRSWGSSPPSSRFDQSRVMQPQVAPAPRVAVPQAAPPRFSAPQIASARNAPTRMSAPRFQAPHVAAPWPSFRAPARQNSGGGAPAPARGSARR